MKELWYIIINSVHAKHSQNNIQAYLRGIAGLVWTTMLSRYHN